MLVFLADSPSQEIDRRNGIVSCSRNTQTGEMTYVLKPEARTHNLTNFLIIASERNPAAVWICASDGLPELQETAIASKVEGLLVQKREVHLLTSIKKMDVMLQGCRGLGRPVTRPTLKLWQMDQIPSGFYCALPNGERSCVYFEKDAPAERNAQGHWTGYAHPLCREDAPVFSDVMAKLRGYQQVAQQVAYTPR